MATAIFGHVRVWARLLAAAIAIGAIPAVVHATTLATPFVAENSPLGFGRNYAPAHAQADRPQAPELPQESAFGYGPIVVDNAYATRGGGMVRLRHYTNSKGLEGIRESGVLHARDKGKVFFDTASGKPLSPRDAEAMFGLKRGRGRHIIETDVPADRVNRVWNKEFEFWELQVKGDVPLSNATFITR